MRHITFLMLLLSTMCFAQEADTTKVFKFAPQSRIYLINSTHFGDNQFADAYGANLGIGTSLSFFSVARFRPALNYEYSQYTLEKPEIVGNVSKSSAYWSLFGTVAYEIPVADKFLVAPDVGVGYAQLRLKPGGDKYGKQDGTQFRFGLTANYKFGNSSSAFIGAHYIYTALDVDTHPDFEDYFNHGSHLQLALGLQFGK